MAKYRKKPVVIDAVQWDGNMSTLSGLGTFEGQLRQDLLGDEIDIETLEGTMTANVGDWIVKGVSGELYPVKPDIFEKTYERIE